MNKYELRTKNKKEAILKSTLDLIKKDGYLSTNIKAISAAAKVSQVSIYNYFGSKINLVKEAIAYLIDDMYSASVLILSEPIPFEDKVKKALALCSAEVNAVLEEFFSAAALEDPQMLQAIKSTIRDSNNKLYEIYVDYGKKEGVIDEAIPTATIVAFINSIGLAHQPAEGSKPDPKYEENMLFMLMNGVARKPE